MRNGNCRRKPWIALVVSMLLAAMPARAIDLLPFDYIPAPPGTNALLGYYIYGTRSSFDSTLTGKASNNTGLDSHIGATRLTHYDEVFGQPAAIQLIVPFGAFYDGRINGFRLNRPEGMFDPILTLAFWPLAQPKAQRWITIGSYTTIPVGEHEPGRALNLGGNRWQQDLQLDFTQGFGEHFYLQLTADWIHFGDNDRAGTGTQKLKQNASFETYAWLTYKPTEGSFVSLGYAGAFGGKQQIDGNANGQKTDFHQIRVAYGQFVTPTLQFVGSLGRDVETSGGFQQDLVLTFRVLKLF